MGEPSYIEQAKRRGVLAKKLFDKEVMHDVIKACQMYDTGDEAGGFALFYAACREAINPAEERLTEAELTEFIERMWAAARCARREDGGEWFPCW